MGSLTTLLASISQIDMSNVGLPSLHLGVDNLLGWMTGWVGGFAWTMILFTVFLKLVLFPLDYYSRRSMKKNQMIQERLAPQLAKLERQCKGDKNLYNQKMMAMMRKEGYRLAGACLPSLITLVLFFFIFSALQSYTCYSNAKIFHEMTAEYNQIIVEYVESEDPTNVAWVQANGNTMPDHTEDGKGMYDEANQRRLAEKYKSVNPRWLWIKNPIRADGFTTAGPTYGEVTTTGIGSPSIKDYLPSGADNTPESKEEIYNSVMGFYVDDGQLLTRPGSIANELNESGFKIFGKHLNGWFLLPILAAGVSFLSQFLTMRMQKDMPGQNTGGFNKVMLFIFPVMMLFFAVSYTSGFSLYIITNSLLTLGGTYLINWLSGIELSKKFARQDKQKNTASYSRKA